MKINYYWSLTLICNFSTFAPTSTSNSNSTFSINSLKTLILKSLIPFTPYIVRHRAVHGSVQPVLGGFFAPHPTGAVSPYPWPHLTYGEVGTGLHWVRCTMPVRCGAFGLKKEKTTANNTYKIIKQPKHSLKKQTNKHIHYISLIPTKRYLKEIHNHSKKYSKTKHS